MPVALFSVVLFFFRYGVPIKSSGRVLRYQRVTRLNADASILGHVSFVQSEHRGRISVSFAQEMHAALTPLRPELAAVPSTLIFVGDIRVLDFSVVVRRRFNQFAPCCMRGAAQCLYFASKLCIQSGDKMVNNERMTFISQ